MPEACRHKWPLALSTALFVLMWLFIASAASADETQQPVRSPRGVTVEAAGFAAVSEGKTVQELHREALLDARRNAVAQAHVSVEARTRVENLRLKEAVVRSLAAGYVQELEVLEAGTMPRSDPPVYRVVVRALIRPLPGPGAAALRGVGVDGRWEPVVVLEVTSDLPGERESALRSTVAEAMRGCGIRVLEAEEEAPALTAKLTIAAPSGGSQQWTKAEWTMGFGPAAAQQGDDIVPITGYWLITEQVDPESHWWERVGAKMAQDAIRLWATPRETSVRFEGVDGARARSLGQALRRVPGSRVQITEEPSEVLATFTSAGDPLRVVGAILDEARMADGARPVRLSLMELTFALAPEPDPGERSADP